MKLKQINYLQIGSYLFFMAAVLEISDVISSWNIIRELYKEGMLSAVFTLWGATVIRIVMSVFLGFFGIKTVQNKVSVKTSLWLGITFLVFMLASKGAMTVGVSLTMTAAMIYIFGCIKNKTAENKSAKKTIQTTRTSGKKGSSKKKKRKK